MFKALKESIAYGLKSEDGPTRRAAYLFFAGICGIALTLGFAVHHYFRLKNASKQALSYAEKAALLAEKEAELKREQLEARKNPPIFNLGQFNLQLTDRKGVRRPRGLTNQAVIEMVVRCDKKATCEYLEEHIVRVRNEITRLFNPVLRDDIMSVQGKRAFRDSIREAVNRWLTREHFKGKVDDLYFPNFIIS